MFDTFYTRPMRFAKSEQWRMTQRASVDILSVTDECLGLDEFLDLFQAPMLTSSYDDVVYFLPLAMEYVRRHGDVAYELIDRIVAFVSTQRQLTELGVMNQCRQALTRWFCEWTSEFVVEHIGPEQAESLGWTRRYDDRVRNAFAITRLLEWLVVYETHADLAPKNICGLVCVHCDQHVVKAAWYSVLARLFKEGWLDVDDKVVECLLMAPRVIQASLSTVQRDADFVAGCGPTYWRDTIDLLS